MACTLVYVVLDIAHAHGELPIEMINDLGSITKYNLRSISQPPNSAPF